MQKKRLTKREKRKRCGVFFVTLYYAEVEHTHTHTHTHKHDDEENVHNHRRERWDRLRNGFGDGETELQGHLRRPGWEEDGTRFDENADDDDDDVIDHHHRRRHHHH